MKKKYFSSHTVVVLLLTLIVTLSILYLSSYTHTLSITKPGSGLVSNVAKSVYKIKLKRRVFVRKQREMPLE
jgi:hypothetical protein